MKRLAAAGVAALALSAVPAMAVPVQWTIPATPLTNGGTLAGTFTYDADTNTYSNLNFAIDRDAETTHFVRIDVPSGYYGNTRLLGLSTAAGDKVAELKFSQPLTNAGGSSTLINVYEGACGEPCRGFSIQVSSSVSSAVTASPPPASIPTLSEWGMILLTVMLAGGAALTLHRRRRAA